MSIAHAAELLCASSRATQVVCALSRGGMSCSCHGPACLRRLAHARARTMMCCPVPMSIVSGLTAYRVLVLCCFVADLAGCGAFSSFWMAGSGCSGPDSMYVACALRRSEVGVVCEAFACVRCPVCCAVSARVCLCEPRRRRLSGSGEAHRGGSQGRRAWQATCTCRLRQ